MSCTALIAVALLFPPSADKSSSIVYKDSDALNWSARIELVAKVVHNLNKR